MLLPEAFSLLATEERMRGGGGNLYAEEIRAVVSLVKVLFYG